MWTLKCVGICMENHASVTGWQKVVFLIQMFLTFGGRYNRYIWDTRMKLLRLLNFNMLFQLENWTVFVFTENRSRDQVMKRAHWLPGAGWSRSMFVFKWLAMWYRLEKSLQITSTLLNKISNIKHFRWRSQYPNKSPIVWAHWAADCAMERSK